MGAHAAGIRFREFYALTTKTCQIATLIHVGYHSHGSCGTVFSGGTPPTIRGWPEFLLYVARDALGGPDFLRSVLSGPSGFGGGFGSGCLEGFWGVRGFWGLRCSADARVGLRVGGLGCEISCLEGCAVGESYYCW